MEKNAPKPSPGKLKRQEQLAEDEEFIFNFARDGFPDSGEPGGVLTLNQALDNLERSGNYESIRVVEEAYQEDGDLLGDHVAIVGTPK